MTTTCDRGARAPQRGRGARAPRGGQARRGPAAHVARVPEGDPADPHRLGRHRARQRAGLPARRRSTRPALNNFGSAVSICQDELAHAHIGYRLLGDLGVDMSALIYEREREGVQVPVRVRRAARLLARPGDGQRALRPGRLRAALRRPPVEHVRPVEARARQGRQGGDLPPAPRPHLGQEAVRRPGREAARAGGGRLDVHPHARVVRPPRRAQAARHPARVRLQGHEQRRAAADVDGAPSCRSWRRSASTSPPTGTTSRSAGSSTARSRRASTRRRKRWMLDEGPISWDEVLVRWKGARPDERETTSSACSAATGSEQAAACSPRRAQQVEARLWPALRDVEDPEIPISVVGMGLIVSVAYRRGRARRRPRADVHRHGLPGDGLHRGRHPRAPAGRARRRRGRASRSCGTRCGRAAASARTRARRCAAWGSWHERAQSEPRHVWEVFARKAYEEPLHHVGTVTEEDEDLALVVCPLDLRRAALDPHDHRAARRDQGGDQAMTAPARRRPLARPAWRRSSPRSPTTRPRSGVATQSGRSARRPSSRRSPPRRWPRTSWGTPARPIPSSRALGAEAGDDEPRRRHAPARAARRPAARLDRRSSPPTCSSTAC